MCDYSISLFFFENEWEKLNRISNRRLSVDDKVHPLKKAVLKSLAILPSGSAGKFLKKIWNLGQLGGEEANFASVLRPPIVCRVPIFVPKSALSLLYQWIEPFF
ncbi:TPA: hypothetical protein ACGV7V_002790, partial [Enterococcus faecium]